MRSLPSIFLCFYADKASGKKASDRRIRQGTATYFYEADIHIHIHIHIHINDQGKPRMLEREKDCSRERSRAHQSRAEQSRAERTAGVAQPLSLSASARRHSPRQGNSNGHNNIYSNRRRCPYAHVSVSLRTHTRHGLPASNVSSSTCHSPNTLDPWPPSTACSRPYGHYLQKARNPQLWLRPPSPRFNPARASS